MYLPRDLVLYHPCPTGQAGLTGFLFESIHIATNILSLTGQKDQQSNIDVQSQELKETMY
jgi:hypothetical protein